ncbi:hypothetical protein GCM10010207_85760 [Streptomyces atratus]|nr:hypothetical protein GCM10010207_85760 [Streptomyces atratus]
MWLYFRFPLSFREVEDLMLERGVIVSYETVRRWCMKFGQAYANGLRRRRPPSRDDRPLRDLGPDHRRCRPAHHGLTTSPKRKPTTPRRAIRHSRTQQHDSAPRRLRWTAP